MVNKFSVRSSNKALFKESIVLRKQGLSYSEIIRKIPIAKSTLNNWLVLAGLTLTAEHLNIQHKKRLENHVVATEASRVTREKKTKISIDDFLIRHKKRLEPLLVSGCMLYEAEGEKNGCCKFSNSDFRVILLFLKFIESYFSRDRQTGYGFRVYIHKNRKKDLNRVLSYWASKLSISKDSISVSWKTHLADFRSNKDYVGQMSVYVRRSTIIRKQIQSLSDIILAL